MFSGESRNRLANDGCVYSMGKGRPAAVWCRACTIGSCFRFDVQQELDTLFILESLFRLLSRPTPVMNPRKAEGRVTYFRS